MADEFCSRPHLPAYQRARSGNGYAVLRFATALRVPAAVRVDNLEASGRGTSFLGSIWPAARIEQGTE